MSGPQRFRKKPVVIEAAQFDGTLASVEALHIPEASQDFCSRTLQIHTLEGVMTAQPGDWIIKGVQGEFYPCKPDIFEATYEPADVVARDETTELKAGFDKMVYRLDAALQDSENLAAEVGKLRESVASLLALVEELEPGGFPEGHWPHEAVTKARAALEAEAA